MHEEVVFGSMGSCEDSEVMEGTVRSSAVLSEEGAREHAMCSTEDNAGSQLIEEVGQGGDRVVGNFPVEKIEEIQNGEIEEVHTDIEETRAEEFEGWDGEQNGRGFDVSSGESVHCIGRENQKNVNERSEATAAVDCALKGVVQRDEKSFGESSHDMGSSENCLADIDVDSFNHLIDSVEGMASMMTNDKFTDEQENKIRALESAESTLTMHQATAICTIPSPCDNHSDHGTDMCSVGGVLIGKEDCRNDRNTPLTECAISREVTMDEEFFGDMNEDFGPWPWWKNSTDTFCGDVSLASVEENSSDEISFTRIGKASSDTNDVPVNDGVVYGGPFREILDCHGCSRSGCHDRVSLYDSDNLLEGKPVNDCLVSERPSAEETEVSERSEGVGPCRPYLADVSSPCVITKSLLKSTHTCRSAGRKTRAKRVARNSLNAKKELYSLECAAFDEKTVKKKRTCTSKAARASIWGALNNISQLFGQRKGPEFKPVKSPKSKKSRAEQTNEKRRKSTKRNMDLSETKSASSVTRIRLKVTLGKETIESSLKKETMDSVVPTSFTLREGGSTVMKELCQPENKTGKQYECLDHQDYKVNVSDGPFLASSLSTELLETNLYFDKTVGNVERKYTEISNYAKDEAVSNGYLDPETSPDSEVINMVPEVQGVERRREHLSGVHLSRVQSITDHENVNVQGKNGNAPSQILQPQQQGSLIMQKANENIASLESGLGSSSLENPDCSLYKGQICKANSRPSKSSKSRKSSGSSRKGDRSKSKGKGNDIKLIEFKRDCPVETGCVDGYGEECTDGATAGSEYAADNMLSNQLVEQDSSPRNAWVLCDDCLKWRRISVALADSIEDTNSSWTCKENLDRNFADCSVPQEKSNSEINEELEISDASGEEDETDAERNYKQLEFSRPTGLQQSSFVHIDSNKFTHRNRRTQSIDEVMVCHCEPSVNGLLGCGDECLNRMLNIECVQGTCPCGDLCSNQQFQRHKYASMQWFRCGKKGFGLQLLEDARKGTFIIEYVGEVLNMLTYEARQRDYAAKGHKHFYFMTLNGSEVIDASAKGNLGRFINHSCDPNCRTEKWMVNGEICIGLFAIRDIKKGEELTFDYNYVRVFGAAVKKCVCGSRHCRGYIGGDPLNSEVVVQSDSDDEFPEPVMLTDGDVLDHLDRDSQCRSLDLATKLKGSKNRQEVKGARISPGSEESVHQFSLAQMERLVDVDEPKEKIEFCSLPIGVALDSEFTSGSVIPDSQKPVSLDIDASRTTEKTDLSSPKISKGKFSDDAGKKLKYEKSNVRRSSSKFHTLVKMSKIAKAINKGKENNVLPISNKDQGMAGKPPMLYTKHRRIVEASSSGRFEAVEEKLNELLDADGGISKRKDAAKGYLKLLFLTAASGDCADGGAIQSNRDLSMILDAVLKTRSKVVLIDIISKNGLQMLHNTLKQYRRDFKKIPILRKLLKVLEYLASREILTLEHISSGPPCPGMESFRESILSLTEHDDKQVHQSARNFRDKYIPKSIRKICHNDRAPALLSNWRDPGVRTSEAIDCLGQPALAAAATPNGSLLQDGTASSIDSSLISGRRVRKSRWDQPGDSVPNTISLQRESHCLDELSSIEKKEICSEDIPPGFSPNVDMPRVLSDTSPMVVEASQVTAQTSNGPFNQAVGQLQERFNSRLPVSYGIPLYILQNLGKPQADNVGWVIAPGMPFHPFPPLPQYPQDKKRQSPTPVDDYLIKDTSADRKQLDECCTTTSVIDESSPSTRTANVYDENICSDNQPPLKRLRASPQDLSRNYFKQQKWNTSKVGPPWLWKRKSWGFSVRSGASGSSSHIGNVVNGNESSSLTEN